MMACTPRAMIMGALCKGCPLRLGRGGRGGFSMGRIMGGLGRFMLGMEERGGLGVKVVRVVGVEGFRRDLFLHVGDEVVII